MYKFERYQVARTVIRSGGLLVTSQQDIKTVDRVEMLADLALVDDDEEFYGLVITRVFDHEETA